MKIFPYISDDGNLYIANKAINGGSNKSDCHTIIVYKSKRTKKRSYKDLLIELISYEL